MPRTHPFSNASRYRQAERLGALESHAGRASATTKVWNEWTAGTRGSRRSQRGSQLGSASLELVVIFPAVLALIFGAVQIALFFHARNVALAAAQEGARAAAAQHGTAAAGGSSTWAFLDRVGG